MKRFMSAAISVATTLSFSLAAVPADAQHRDRDRDRWERSDRSHHRAERRADRRDDRRSERRWRNWGGNYGYNGYNGRWRSGQRYDNWRNRSYYLNDYRGYGLPAPRRGYRYYRDSNSGDIVMAAIATGVIAMILTSDR